MREYWNNVRSKTNSREECVLSRPATTKRGPSKECVSISSAGGVSAKAGIPTFLYSNIPIKVFMP